MGSGKNASRGQTYANWTSTQLSLCHYPLALSSCPTSHPLDTVNLCDDLCHKLITHSHLNPTDDDVFDYGHYLIENITVDSSGKCLSDIQDMYPLQQQWGNDIDNPILQEELAYGPVEMGEKVEDLYPRFNPKQKDTFDKVMDSVNNNNRNLFFLLSAGKTHVCNTISAAVRAQGKVALCVAFSAIATLLLDGGLLCCARVVPECAFGHSH
jgi:hypothetical protein